MLMTPGIRRLVLTVHITVSVGWIGTVVAYLALVFAAFNTQDALTLRSSWIAMELMGRFAIVPLALLSLLTGIVMALGTRWGLFRHYWVLISLILTAMATFVLVDHMQIVSYYAGIASQMGDTNLSGLRSGLSGELLHAGLGVLTLIVIQILNVYKPRGVTRYGWRKQLEERTAQQPTEMST